MLKLNQNIWTLAFLIFSIKLTGQTQQLSVRDFVIYSVKDLKLASDIKVLPSVNSGKGKVGSKENIFFKNASNITADVFSRGRTELDKEININGNITANNYLGLSSEILNGDKDVVISGNVTVNGKINISTNGSSIGGFIRQNIGSSYSGPVPALGRTNGILDLPAFPALPIINDFMDGTRNLIGNQTVVPGEYRDVVLTNNQTLTLNGVGTYVFKSITNSGNSKVKIVFDFKN